MINLHIHINKLHGCILFSLVESHVGIIGLQIACTMYNINLALVIKLIHVRIRLSKKIDNFRVNLHAVNLAF